MKIALVDGQVDNRWQSCSTILKNILKTYEQIKGIELFRFQLQANSQNETISCFDAANKIFALKPDIISFADYQPVPNTIIKFLSLRYKSAKKRPKLIFHIYGDFSIFLSKWNSIEKELKEFECKFLAASEAQTKLLQKFIKDPNLKLVECHPFPVDTKLFNFSEEKRVKARLKYDCKENEVVIVYTGRLTLQKNTLPLLNIVDLLDKFLDKKVKILFAGPFDDLGYTFFGKYISIGEYQYLWNTKYNSVKKELTNVELNYLGVLDSSQLVELYHAGDCYINLSTHNDEDFGMAPAEAFCCGMEGVLSKWGGLGSFKIDGNVNFVKVTLNKINGPVVDFNSACKLLLAYAKKDNHNSKTRHEASKKYIEKFSVNSLSKALEQILISKFQKFENFSHDFKKVVKLFEKNYSSPYLSTISKINEVYLDNRKISEKVDTTLEVHDLYLRIYESYI